MMETIVTVAHDILIVAGAICVILMIVILIALLGLIMRANTMIKQTQRTYNQITTLVLEPFKFLTSWLSNHLDAGDDDDDIEMELPRKKKKK